MRLHIVAVEDGRHGLDLLERPAQALDQRLFEHARMQRGFVAVFFENIPAAELQIFDLRQRHEVLDFRRVVVGSLAEPDGVQLRDRADRLRHSQFDGFHTGDECRGHGAHARDQNAKLPVGWLNGGCGLLRRCRTMCFLVLRTNDLAPSGARVLVSWTRAIV